MTCLTFLMSRISSNRRHKLSWISLRMNRRILNIEMKNPILILKSQSLTSERSTTQHKKANPMHKKPLKKKKKKNKKHQKMKKSFFKMNRLQEIYRLLKQLLSLSRRSSEDTEQESCYVSI